MKLTVQQVKDMGYVESSPGLYTKPISLGVKLHTDTEYREHNATKPPKRIRQSTKPLMNGLELEWLEVLKCRFKIVEPQSVRLMLGRGIWYKPDFIAWPCGFESQDIRMRAFECKGPHSFRGGMENLKVAAHKYPQIKFTLVWKQDGKWQEQTVLP